MRFYSKIDWYDLRILSARNQLYVLFELIGIHNEYTNQSALYHNQQFSDYYVVKRGSTKYHYVNIGERIVKAHLLGEGIHVSREDFRLISRTHKNFPVISTCKMGDVFCATVDVILKERIENYARQSIDAADPTVGDILYFQYENVRRFQGYDGMPQNKIGALRRIDTQWKAGTRKLLGA